MNTNTQKKIITVMTAIFLTCAYICWGYVVCAGIPQTTSFLAAQTIDDSASPFTTDELVKGAVAVRDYSFDTHDRRALESTIRSMNQSAETSYADDPFETGVPDPYTLSEDAIGHLDDVNTIASTAFYPILGITAIAIFCLMCALWMFGMKIAGRALLAAGIIGLSLIAVLALWAIFGFSSLFTVFHGLFFADGSWTFPADSLLITMLPQDFWIGMAGIWLATTALLCVVSIILGLIIRKREGRTSKPAGDSTLLQHAQ